MLLPSAARAVDSIMQGGSSGGSENTSTAETWNATERVLDGAAEYFANPDSEFVQVVLVFGSRFVCLDCAYMDLSIVRWLRLQLFDRCSRWKVSRVSRTRNGRQVTRSGRSVAAFGST